MFAEFSFLLVGMALAASLLSACGGNAPHAGFNDIHLNLDWNWSFNSAWLFNTSAKYSHLRAGAADSPLVQRPNGWRISSALARRF